MRTLKHGITCALLSFGLVACARTVSVDRSVGPEAPTPKEAVGITTVAAAVTPVPASIVQAPAPTNELAKADDAAACPKGMILVEGEYCPEVEEKCLEWLDPPSSRYAHFRCAHYEKPSKCLSKERVHKRYCIDATERVEEGSNLPKHFMSWTSSKKLCESEGARLCRESEWIFACEGEEMRPYPYGFDRDSNACNVDIFEGIGKVGALRDHRTPVGSHAKCASPFGVQDMAGNVEEWAQADGPGQGSKMGWKEVLKGSWWIPSRHACRQFQVGHNDVYNGGETGTRCCKDAPPR
jgi:hypothetical protein